MSMEHNLNTSAITDVPPDQSVAVSGKASPESNKQGNETTVNPTPEHSPSVVTYTIEPAQTQVLRNLDILESIFSFFSNGNSGIGNRMFLFPESQYLLWASLTSKDMFDPAMNILWRSMESLMPILRLIPVLAIDVLEGSITTTGVITEEHIRDLFRYTRRVRHVRVDNLMTKKWCGEMTPEIYFSVVQTLAEGSTVLVPCLQTLEILAISNLSKSDLSSIFLLPSSVLSEISIGGINLSTDVSSSTLLYRAAMSNSVKRLKLEGTLSSTTSLDHLHDFTRLESIDLSALLHSAHVSKILVHIGRIHSLKNIRLRLEVTEHFNSWTSPFPSSPPVYMFQSLRSLDLSGHTSTILFIFKSIKQAPSLDSVTLHVLGRIIDGNNNLGQCIQHIASKAPNLVSLQVRAHTAISIEEEYIQYLASFKKLQRMDLPKISFDAVESLANQSWPAVKYLNLKAGCQIQKPPQLAIKSGMKNKSRSTLGSGKKNKSPSSTSSGGESLSLRLLPHFLSICPNLETLLVSVNLNGSSLGIQEMQAAMDRQYQDEGKARSHPLKELVLFPCVPFSNSSVPVATFETTIQHAFFIARFIEANFPNLLTLDLSNLTEIDRSWGEGIEHMMKEFQKMRKAREAARSF